MSDKLAFGEPASSAVVNRVPLASEKLAFKIGNRPPEYEICDSAFCVELSFSVPGAPGIVGVVFHRTVSMLGTILQRTNGSFSSVDCCWSGV
jgi:hypothetical protein